MLTVISDGQNGTGDAEAAAGRIKLYLAGVPLGGGLGCTAGLGANLHVRF